MTRIERLKHVATISFSNVDKKSVEGEESVRLCNYTDVYYNDRINKAMAFMAATAPLDQVGRFALRKGDVLITKDSETADDIAISALVVDDLPGVLCGYHLALIRPKLSRVHPAFLHWALTSGEARQQFSVAATGVTRFGLRQDAVGDVEIPVPSLADQTRIADHLDAETTRIDALIAKKREMIQLLDERWHRFLADVLASGQGLRFKHLLDAPLAYGVLVPDHAGSDGVPMLRIMDLAKGQPEPDSLARISPELSAEYRRTIVRAGDLVVSVVGTLGRSIEITAMLDGCNLNRPLARVQLQEDVPRSLVRYWFESIPFRTQALAATSGDSAQPTLGLGDLKNFVVGFPPDRQEWASLTSALESHRTRVYGVTERLTRQIELLIEHRRALITAAVTGGVSVPGVAA